MVMTKTTTNVMDLLPRSLDDIPAVQDAQRVYDAASERNATAAVEYERLNALLDESAEGEGLSALAERALSGASLSTLCDDATRLVADIAAARQKLKIAEKAEELAHARLDAARAAALESLVPQVQQAYATVAERLAACMLELLKACEQEQQVRRVFQDGEIRLIPNRIRSAALTGGFNFQAVGRWLKESCEAGLVSPATFAEFEKLAPRWQIR